MFGIELSVNIRLNSQAGDSAHRSGADASSTQHSTTKQHLTHYTMKYLHQVNEVGASSQLNPVRGVTPVAILVHRLVADKINNLQPHYFYQACNEKLHRTLESPKPTSLTLNFLVCFQSKM